MNWSWVQSAGREARTIRSYMSGSLFCRARVRDGVRLVPQPHGDVDGVRASELAHPVLGQVVDCEDELGPLEPWEPLAGQELLNLRQVDGCSSDHEDGNLFAQELVRDR